MKEPEAVGPVLALPSATAELNLDALEREVIRFALEYKGGNQTRAAGFVGLTRSALLYRMRKYGLRSAAWVVEDSHAPQKTCGAA